MTTGAAIPDPVVPRFGEGCLSDLVPGLLGSLDTAALGGPGATERRAARERADAARWLPDEVRGARQLVLLVLDGLGAEQLAQRAASAPLLSSASVATLTSVAPTTTAVALTSLATGLPPAVHGVVGYRVSVGDDVLNLLGWRLGTRDARQLVPPRRFQPFPAFSGVPSAPVVSRADYAATGFTAAHLADAPLHGWHTASGLVVEVRRLLDDGEPFVYAYYDGIDRTAHATGLAEHYDAELRAVDRLVGDVVDVLPAGTALVVTADHGQVEVGRALEVFDAEVMGCTRLVSGEGRFRWLHARPGAGAALLDAVTERYSHLAWVKTLDEIVDEGWLGGVPSAEVRSRLGDVAVVPFAATAFLDPADTGEQRLVCRHGSLTTAEMLVPVLAWRGGA